MPSRLPLSLRLPEHARERLNAFSSFVWHRYVEDRCFETAAVLAYGTIFALVPLTVTAVGIVAAFPLFEEWNDTLSDFLFTHFVPGAARAVEDYLLESAAGATKMTAAGVIAVLASALFMMKSVEDSLNRIWRVTTHRSTAARFLVYWTSLTLGPLLVAASLALSSRVLAQPWVVGTRLSGLTEVLFSVLPFAVELGAFTLIYALVPNQRVLLRHAIIGGVLASLLFEVAKFGFGWYLRQVPTYQQIYGTLAVLPIFLIWIYLSWLIVLLGASIAASLSAFRFQPSSQRLPVHETWLATLRLLIRFLRAQREGEALSLPRLREIEPNIDDDVLQHLLDVLTEAEILERTEDQDWVLKRDPHQLKLAEVYAALRLHAPLKVDSHGPGIGDAVGQRAVVVTVPLGQALAQVLDQPLAMLEPAPPKD